MSKNAPDNYLTEIEPHVHELNKIAGEEKIDHCCLILTPGIADDEAESSQEDDAQGANDMDQREHIATMQRTEIWAVPWKGSVREALRTLCYPTFNPPRPTPRDTDIKLGISKETDKATTQRFLSDLRSEDQNEDLQAELYEWWGDREKDEGIWDSDAEKQESGGAKEYVDDEGTDDEDYEGEDMADEESVISEAEVADLTFVPKHESYVRFRGDKYGCFRKEFGAMEAYDSDE